MSWIVMGIAERGTVEAVWLLPLDVPRPLDASRPLDVLKIIGQQ